SWPDADERRRTPREGDPPPRIRMPASTRRACERIAASRLDAMTGGAPNRDAREDQRRRDGDEDPERQAGERQFRAGDDLAEVRGRAEDTSRRLLGGLGQGRGRTEHAARTGCGGRGGC